MKFLIYWMLFINISTFILYFMDKRSAEKNEHRTSELKLLMFGLAGGWLGGLIARHVFRHKTIKQPFRTQFWLTTLASIVLTAFIIFSGLLH